jgi:hypothetical protein
MQPFNRSSMLAVLLFSMAGCGGGSSDSSSPDQNPPAAEDDLTKALSQDMVCAATAAADDSNNGQGLVAVPESKLKGDALKDYKAWQKGMSSDYPSSAYELPVKQGGKTYTFWLVVEMNDGGGSMGVYRTSGAVVATESGSESGPAEWTAPANKCSH